MAASASPPSLIRDFSSATRCCISHRCTVDFGALLNGSSIADRSLPRPAPRRAINRKKDATSRRDLRISPQLSSAVDDLVGGGFLRGHEWISEHPQAAGSSRASAANSVTIAGEGIFIAEHFILHAQGMQLPHPFAPWPG